MIISFLHYYYIETPPPAYSETGSPSPSEATSIDQSLSASSN